MKLITATAIALISTGPLAHAECIVADPSPTPLNARTAPYGRVIGTLDNGQVVTVLDGVADIHGHPWVYVADGEGTSIGWVYRKYVTCKGELPR